MEDSKLIFIEIVILFGFFWWNKVKFSPINCQNVFLFCKNPNIPSKQARITEPIRKIRVRTINPRILRMAGKLKIIKAYCFRIFQRFGVIIDNRGSSSAGIQRLPKFLWMNLCINGHERKKQQFQPIEMQF
jgi:hypothetical protein